MALEMGHVKNFDIRVSTLVFGLVVAIGFLADFMFRMAFWAGQGARGGDRDNAAGAIALASLIFALFASVIAYLLGPLIQAGISRQREYLADATGAMTTRNPEGLASALHKLGEYGKPLKRQSASMAHMWMSDPLKPGFLARIYATHPPIADRIKRLLEIGGKF
jgi:heat shock protein HtpX